MKQDRKMLGVSDPKTRSTGFLLTEALLGLALLGLLLILVARFEYYAGTLGKSLEREYVANAAAESQFERLRAGLAVLDPQAFRQKYPGLELEYRPQPAEGNGVVTIKTVEPESQVLVRFVGPVPRITSQPGVKK